MGRYRQFIGYVCEVCYRGQFRGFSGDILGDGVNSGRGVCRVFFQSSYYFVEGVYVQVQIYCKIVIMVNIKFYF